MYNARGFSLWAIAESDGILLRSRNMCERRIFCFWASGVKNSAKWIILRTAVGGTNARDRVSVLYLAAALLFWEMTRCYVYKLLLIMFDAENICFSLCLLELR